MTLRTFVARAYTLPLALAAAFTALLAAVVATAGGSTSIALAEAVIAGYMGANALLLAVRPKADAASPSAEVVGTAARARQTAGR